MGMDFPALISAATPSRNLGTAKRKLSALPRRHGHASPSTVGHSPSLPQPTPEIGWGPGYLLPQPAAPAGAAGSMEGRSNTQDQPAPWLHASLSKKPQSWNQYHAFGCRSQADPQAELGAGRLQSSVPAAAAGQTHRHHLHLTCSLTGQRSIPGIQGMAQGWEAQPHHRAGFRGVMGPSSLPGCSSTTSAPVVPKGAQWIIPTPAPLAQQYVAGSFVQVMIWAEDDQESGKPDSRRGFMESLPPSSTASR